jgi:NAD(P)H-hydrate repair Nnr-like enzyme with NAD(P)H-hydrate dehydratase domain
MTWTAAVAAQDAGVGVISVWCALGCNQVTTFYVAAEIMVRPLRRSKFSQN